MAAVIEARLALVGDDAALMRSLSQVELRNWNGLAVGSLRAAEALREGT